MSSKIDSRFVPDPCHFRCSGGCVYHFKGYRAAKKRPASARSVRDELLIGEVGGLHEVNYSVYGVRKMHAAMLRAGWEIGRDQVGRLMRKAGLRGMTRGKMVRTTVSSKLDVKFPDLVKRNFTATRPNQLWVADITFVPTWAGFAYVAFVTDVSSRKIVGWNVDLPPIDGNWPTDYWRASGNELWRSVPAGGRVGCAFERQEKGEIFLCDKQPIFQPFIAEQGLSAEPYLLGSKEYWYLQENNGFLEVPPGCRIFEKITRPLFWQKITIGQISICDDRLDTGQRNLIDPENPIR